MATLSEPHEISTGIFNLLNNCNSTKDSGQQTGRTKRHATQLKSPEGGHIGQAGEGERRKCRDWGCPGTEPKPELELRAPCIPELQLSQEREEFELLLLHLCPTVLREGSAYNTAEPSNPGRDLKTKPEGRRVKWGVSFYYLAEDGQHRRGAYSPTLLELVPSPTLPVLEVESYQCQIKRAEYLQF